MSSTSASGTSSRRPAHARRVASRALARAALVLGAAAALGALPAASQAKVFYSRSEALELAFPDADRIDSETFVLAESQIERIEALASCPVETRLVKIYTGRRGEEILGYAVIDVHNVRTLPEAFMVVLDPAGRVNSLRVLAFHEPLDYLPAERWYGQFGDKVLGQPLRVGGDIHGVVGATLSARATTRGVRRVLAYYEVLIRHGEGER